MKNKLIIIFFIFSIKMTLFSSPPKTPFLGVQFSEVNHSLYTGIRVDNIVHKSAASKSKLKKNDIIVYLDTLKIPTENAKKYFKNYITKEKKIGDPLRLDILREELLVSREINNQNIKVDFDMKDISNIINNLNYKNKESFQFEKKVTKKIIYVTLENKPYTLKSTPNITSQFEPKIKITAPYYNEFFNQISSNHNYKSTLDILREKQLNNEFWDDSLRLNTIRYLHVNFFKLPAFSKVMKQELLNMSPKKSVSLAFNLLDLKKMDSLSTSNTFPQTFIFNDHLDFIENNIQLAKQNLNKAYEKLDISEKEFVKNNLNSLKKALEKSFIISDDELISNNNLNKLIEIGKKINTNYLMRSSYYMSKLSNRDWLDIFEETIKRENFEKTTIEEVSGKILFKKYLEEGLLIIGSKENNTYIKNASFIIDIGGNDTYKSNFKEQNSLISFLIDMNGNDFYTSTKDFSQAGTLFGYSLLIDTKGNDSYRSTSFSQGSAIMGVSQLIDFEGNDSYVSQDFSQGIGFFGVGILVDTAGKDTYHSGYFSQGVGMSKGVGFLIDLKGNDNYFLSNKLDNTYKTPGIFKAAGQGFGFGLRNFSSGGIGLLYDYKGNDHYESGNFSLGTGYFYGLGMFFDTSGNDSYKGSRYSIATSAHSAIGLFVETSGQDTYSSNFGSSIAIAWDYSNSYFLDASGDDIYLCENKSFTLAEADHNSFAFFNDKKGNDQYLNNSTKPNASNSYNDGKSLAIFLDENGKNDFYLNNFKNNTIQKVTDSFIYLDLNTSLQKFIKE